MTRFLLMFISIWELLSKVSCSTDYEMLLQLDQPRQGEANRQPAATEEQLASIPSFTLQKNKVWLSHAGTSHRNMCSTGSQQQLVLKLG